MTKKKKTNILKKIILTITACFIAVFSVFTLVDVPKETKKVSASTDFTYPSITLYDSFYIPTYKIGSSNTQIVQNSLGIPILLETSFSFDTSATYIYDSYATINIRFKNLGNDDFDSYFANVSSNSYYNYTSTSVYPVVSDSVVGGYFRVSDSNVIQYQGYYNRTTLPSSDLSLTFSNSNLSISFPLDYSFNIQLFYKDYFSGNIFPFAIYFDAWSFIDHLDFTSDLSSIFNYSLLERSAEVHSDDSMFSTRLLSNISYDTSLSSPYFINYRLGGSSSPSISMYLPSFYNLFSNLGNYLDYDYYITSPAASYQNGYDAGYEEGEDVGYDAGYDVGYEEGEDIGYSAGYDEGVRVNTDSSYAQGYDDGEEYGYEWGFREGENSGLEKGFENGKIVGKNEGYQLGLESANQYNFSTLISAVIDVPVNTFTSLFNFEILGVNMSGFFLGLLTLCVIITVVKLIL